MPAARAGDGNALHTVLPLAVASQPYEAGAVAIAGLHMQV